MKLLDDIRQNLGSFEYLAQWERQHKLDFGDVFDLTSWADGSDPVDDVRMELFDRITEPIKEQNNAVND